MTAISLLMLAMVEGGSGGLISSQNLFLFITSAVLLAIFFFVENRAVDPIIPQIAADVAPDAAIAIPASVPTSAPAPR